MTTHLSGEAKIVRPNWVRYMPRCSGMARPPLRLRARVGRDRVREDDVGDEARQSDAGGHVVVDAQHVGAQTLVYRDVGARADAGLRIPVVDLSHLVLSLRLWCEAVSARETKYGDAPPALQGPPTRRLCAANAGCTRWPDKAACHDRLTSTQTADKAPAGALSTAPGAKAAEQRHQRDGEPASPPPLPERKR